MLRSVLGKSLWDQRRLLVAWATGVAAVTAIYASFYPSARQSAAQSVRNLPPAFRQAFNVTQMSSPAGYLEATVFNFIVPLLVLLFVAVVGARAIAGDEEAGTLDLLLAHPVSRAQVIGQRFGALVVSTAAVGAAVLIALLVVAGPGELDIPAANLAAMSLHLVLLGVCFGALALAIGAATGRRALVYGGTAAAGLLASSAIRWPRNWRRCRGCSGSRHSPTTAAATRCARGYSSATRGSWSQSPACW